MNKKLFILLTFVCFLAIPQAGLQADIVVRYDGPMAIHPQGPMHKGDITGKLNLLFDGDNFSSVRVDLDLPVMGKTSYPSKEQAMNLLPRSEQLLQLSVVYKLNGPIHKWYFVVVANSTGGPFDGIIYKVTDTMESIETILKAGIDIAPITWKEVGTVSLTAH